MRIIKKLTSFSIIQPVLLLAFLFLNTGAVVALSTSIHFSKHDPFIYSIILVLIIYIVILDLISAKSTVSPLLNNHFTVVVLVLAQCVICISFQSFVDILIYYPDFIIHFGLNPGDTVVAMILGGILSSEIYTYLYITSDKSELNEKITSFINCVDEYRNSVCGAEFDKEFHNNISKTGKELCNEFQSYNDYLLKDETKLKERYVQFYKSYGTLPNGIQRKIICAKQEEDTPGEKSGELYNEFEKIMEDLRTVQNE